MSDEDKKLATVVALTRARDSLRAAITQERVTMPLETYRLLMNALEQAIGA